VPTKLYMDSARLALESTILERYLPRRYAFVHPTDSSRSYLDVGLKTKSGNTYRLKILIPPDYPSAMPLVYVVHPKPLYDYHKQDLTSIGASGKMHVLTSADGCVQLCHFKGSLWHTNITLYKVALKCLIWLEAYHNHLLTGNDIDYYLRHCPQH